MSKPHKAQIKTVTLELVIGDIVQQEVDAIVNAANSSLLGGGGVDGAIHRAAGPGLLEETRALGGCETGDAKITGGHRLPAKYVIHAVGPVYKPGDPEVANLLASAYRRSLTLAAQHTAKRVAFPAVSTGVYRYPVEEAAEVALQTVCEFLQLDDNHEMLKLVRFVLFSDSTFQHFANALRRLSMREADVVLETVD